MREQIKKFSKNFLTDTPKQYPNELPKNFLMVLLNGFPTAITEKKNSQRNISKFCRKSFKKNFQRHSQDHSQRINNRVISKLVAQATFVQIAEKKSREFLKEFDKEISEEALQGFVEKNTKKWIRCSKKKN